MGKFSVCFGPGTVFVPPPTFWEIRSEPASWSSCPDTSSAAKTWRWETLCSKRKRGRNRTNSSPRTVILKTTNVLTVNQTCSSASNFSSSPHLLTNSHRRSVIGSRDLNGTCCKSQFYCHHFSPWLGNIHLLLYCGGRRTGVLWFFCLYSYS